MTGDRPTPKAEFGIGGSMLSKPVHRVQGAWMQDTPEDVLGIHGTWLNAPTTKWWDDPNAPQALDRFNEMQDRFKACVLKSGP